MAGEDYKHQHRGDRGAYERYLAGMDVSMRQKVALTAAHFLCIGKIADLGMGSGSGSHAFAQLYPGLEVVGVDVNDEMVAMARERFQLPNLSFRVGDIAEQVFEAGSMDGLLNSSVLHHVTSFNEYEHTAAVRALEAQAAQLAPHGVLVVRDFVDPGPAVVVLELPESDGDDSEDPATCSSAALLRRFAREFRKLSPQPGFAYRALPAAPDGLARFSLSHKLAAEFLLRKDYRADWDTEVLEEYTFLTQQEFEAAFARLGLRVLASVPIRNPWIVRNRFEGKARIFAGDGVAALEFPATNLLIAGEKVPQREGVRFRELTRSAPTGFLKLEHFQHQNSGKVHDLVFRPNRTLDVVPYFELDGDLSVLARRSYPRPILQCSLDSACASLDGSAAVGYVTEPLSVVQAERPFGQSVEQLLMSVADLSSERILRMFPGSVYFPSPGGIQEEVRSAFVEIAPVFVERAMDDTSGCSTSGHVRAVNAHQVLRAAQVSGLPDARLELGVYELLSHLGQSVGPWIGEEVALGPAPNAQVCASIDSLLRPEARRLFCKSGPSTAPFLELHAVEFEELASDGSVLAKVVRELVLPSRLSHNTVSAAVLCREDGRVLLGVDDMDLPAVQAFEGRSDVWVTPAWRLPRDVCNLTNAREFLRERLLEQHGIELGEVWTLGGRYFPSAGLTPEVVYPFAVEVRSIAASATPLSFFDLAELVARAEQIVDGHLRISLWRAAHALGVVS
ncbi:MAG TPA: methyltransferase domain-containing protein [Polyangiaceae bacterium]|nr:methyltransferase domain-containing protein [Polyangiaceae bacterium]